MTLRRSRKNTAPEHPTTRYALDVVEQRVVAGRLVRKAAQRHLDDRAHGAARGLTFDETAATRGIAFFPELLRHADGAPFTLAPFQAFIVGSLFGWKTAGVRRFRHLFLATAKGGGKSPLAAGIALAILFLDEEPGSELYCAAVTREQAGVQFRDCSRMAAGSPALARQLDITDHNIAHRSTGSFIRPVSSEARALDGKRVAVALIDELMEHPNSDVYDKMRAGTKTRKQPLIVCTTNAGYDKHSVAWRLHEYSVRVLDGMHQNDGWLAYIAALDACEACRAAGHEQPAEDCPDCDQWTDERVWEKANPLVDRALPRTYLREQVEEALAMPSKENIVKRLNFSLWTSASVRWLPSDAWAACGDLRVTAAALRGRPCIGGLDLSETRDLTAMVLLFPDVAGGYTVLPFFWCPEEDIRQRAQRDHVPYDEWARDGWLEATPGNVVDYAVLHARILALGQAYEIREIGFDPWRARQLAAQLVADGVPMVESPQTLAHVSPAARDLERLLLSRQLRHGHHPVLDWCAGNVVVEVDANGNIRPSKRKSTERIDGVSALVMALARAAAAPPEDPGSELDARVARGEAPLITL
jgi:phage terminase large subunit-like protein